MHGHETAEPRNSVELRPPLPFKHAQKLERALLDSAVQRGAGCDWSVWRTQQALIAPSLTTRAKGFQNAAHEMLRCGWPVYIRDTGGDITPQWPGVVNVSSAFLVERTTEISIRATYERFCAPLLAFFSSLGFDAYLSSVQGAFCDGEFNIVIGGRKLAGTAQRWRMTRLPDGRNGVAVLAHAAILADVDIAAGIEATNRFYALCGTDRKVDAAQHVSTAGLCGPDLAAAPLAARLAHFLDRERAV
ncbi:Lipoate-protein ligase A [Hyphomicrobium nitrativorans NL23]|uniref:Lipoate-protein ligase A n=1 Tax=Hyphomicrobium nitrativorans NL23 TaxID=1029756 RepID=V5SBF7_9HYPH|nr:lipoate--protein ligase A [Hyphomicrobium nitrativorans]AHB47360.1 Lipoate-protein ligase A [Hyphomicrobium nitrativorans NL23]